MQSLEHSCIEKSLRWKRAGASDKMRKTKAAEKNPLTFYALNASICPLALLNERLMNLSREDTLFMKKLIALLGVMVMPARPMSALPVETASVM